MRPGLVRGAGLTAALCLALLPGCGAASRHPAITTGIVGGSLALGTCTLASDNTRACLATSGGVGALLGLAAAAALWLGGDGHTVLIEEPAATPPDDGRPLPVMAEPGEPGTPPAGSAPGQPAAPAAPSAPVAPVAAPIAPAGASSPAAPVAPAPPAPAPAAPSAPAAPAVPSAPVAPVAPR